MENQLFQIAGTDSRTVLFGYILFLFHSVSFEEIFDSDSCLMHCCNFSGMNCSSGHGVWRPARHEQQKNKISQQRLLGMFHAEFEEVSFKSLFGNSTEVKFQWQCDAMASGEDGQLFATEAET